MNKKKISAILISLAFLLVVVFSSISILSVKDVNVTYALSENVDASAIQRALDKNLGKNFLFLSEEQVKDSLKGNHYVEVLSVDKQFPNVVNVMVKERREIYHIEYQGQSYVADETGFILKQGLPSGEARQTIKLLIGNGINLTSVQPGQTIKTDKDKLMSIVFDMAKSVNLTDCIESIVIEEAYGEYDVVFNAYTGVQIRIRKALIQGKQKAINAFKAYDEKLTDYQKNSGEILSILLDDGNLRVNYNGREIMTVKR